MSRKNAATSCSAHFNGNNVLSFSAIRWRLAVDTIVASSLAQETKKKKKWVVVFRLDHNLHLFLGGIFLLPPTFACRKENFFLLHPLSFPPSPIENICAFKGEDENRLRAAKKHWNKRPRPDLEKEIGGPARGKSASQLPPFGWRNYAPIGKNKGLDSFVRSEKGGLDETRQAENTARSTMREAGLFPKEKCTL